MNLESIKQYLQSWWNGWSNEHFRTFNLITAAVVVAIVSFAKIRLWGGRRGRGRRKRFGIL